MVWAPVKRLRLGGSAFADNIVQFLFLDIFEALAAAFEGFKCLNQCLRHPAVCLVGTADDCKTVGAGDALVAVFIVETYTEEVGLLLVGVVHEIVR